MRVNCDSWQVRAILALAIAWIFLGLNSSSAWSQGPPMPNKAAIKDKLVQAARPISNEEEYRVGRAVAASFLAEYPLYDNPQLNRYVNEVGLTLSRKSRRPNPYRGFYFAVLNSPEPNAFACPGGIILVTRGFIRMCDTEDELAALLAHEVAHVVHRNGIKSIKMARWTEVVTLIRAEKSRRRGGHLAQLVDLYGDAVVDVRKTIKVNGYSRQAEWSADHSALFILARAGYNPKALVTLLEKMAALEKKGDAPGGIFRTHPPAALRLEKIKELGLEAPASVPGEPARTKRFGSFKKLAAAGPAVNVSLVQEGNKIFNH
ncbi:MAG: peptidase M48 [Deltaproteobacteria bacterium]|nr:peptidase M48 [Deltaproteobacteria bacterium]